jgi:hypothetical protein
MRYEYKAEDGAGVPAGAPHERGRTAAERSANRHLKRIRYGNTVPWPAGGTLPDEDTRWLFEVVLDYGEHDPEQPVPGEVRPWGGRPDPFSSYRAAPSPSPGVGCAR